MSQYPARIARIVTAAAVASAVCAATALGGPAAGASSAPPSLDAAEPLSMSIVVQPFGTRATVKVYTSPATVLTSSTKVLGAAGAGPAHATPIPGPVNYQTLHEYTVPDLTSNTRYELTVVATTQDGATATGSATFTTLKQRVRVTLREINITDDGDWIGDGEPFWEIYVLHGKGSFGDGVANSCFPLPTNGKCKPGSYDEGRIFPRNSAGQFLTWTFAEENFDRHPDTFYLVVNGHEEDEFPLLSDLANSLQQCLDGNFCDFDSKLGEPWKVPQGMEFASKGVVLTANGFDGGMYATMTFTYELFHDNLSYPSARNSPFSTWK
jgi:hypothetical protein